jgi:hypothetical protein
MLKNMLNNRNLVLSLFLVLTIAMTLVALPNANAQTYTKASYPFIGATPNPVGVGQPTLLHIGVLEGLQATADGWEGLTVTVERPDGTNETLGPYRTDSTGGTGDTYTPTMEGTYYLQLHFPAQNFTWPPGGRSSPNPAVECTVLYKAGDSERIALNVTAEPIKYYPGAPLPTEYWTRPIDGQLREWSTIAGNWLTQPANRFAPYNDAPESAHILWAKPLAMGGVVGGETGDVGFETGDAYEGFFAGTRNSPSSVILGGKLYYNDYSYRADGTAVEQNVVCMDLHTGEELWVRNWNNTRLQFGQLFYWQSYNYQGTYPFLWSVTGTTWNAYDASTGRWIYGLTDVPSGNRVYGPNGEIFIYHVDLAHGWMMLWNSSRVISDSGSFSRALVGQTFNVSMYDYQTRSRNSGYEWNKTIPTGLPGSIVATYPEDRIIGTNLAGGQTGTSVPSEIVFWGINLKSGHEGELLFNTTWSPPNEWISGSVTIGIQGGQANTMVSSIDDKVGVIWVKETRQHYGVSLDTGKLIWGPTESQYYLDAWEGTQLTTHLIAYGRLYAVGMGGILYCYDVTTGERLWIYEAEDPYSENLFANNWWLGAPFISDGKIYLGHAEHSPNMPMPRGAPFICVNATSGDEIWRINGAFRQTGWGGLAIIGDSIIATMDTYDQQIYAIGKGPSQTTVTAGPKSSVMGTSVVIEGTVTDVSPGTSQDAIKLRFPNGVPAVSDASQSDWMLYVYKQFSRPSNASGVSVTLSVIDSNNNYREIGTTTSDADGFFSYSWTPDIDGKYTVYATFDGSEAYYPSRAVAAFTVDPAPDTTPPPEQPQSMADLYFVPAIAGLFAAIIVVGVLTILMLRKRP